MSSALKREEAAVAGSIVAIDESDAFFMVIMYAQFVRLLPMKGLFIPVFFVLMRQPQRRSAPPDRYLHFGMAAWHGQPRVSDRYHRHNEVELLLIVRGKAVFLFSHRRIEFAAKTLHVFWGGIPHRLLEVS